MKQHHFLRGAFVLSAAGIVIKLMGAVYRIPLARLIGGEGMGLYQMAYPVYTMILALSTSGIPVAISILVAKKEAQGDYAGGKRVFLVALLVLTLFGLLLALLMFFASYWLAENVLHDTRAFLPLIAISPALFITAVMSAFRGYFQGNQIMTPTAVSQILEQSVRVITVLVLAYLLMPYGIEFAAAGATFGAVTGSLAALLVLFAFYASFKDKKNTDTSIKQKDPIFLLIKWIAAIAIPLSLGGLVMPLMQLVDAVLIPFRLQASGFSIARATELFGQFSGMANTLINLPAVITLSLAISLVPAISAVMVEKQMGQVRQRIATAIRFAFIIGIPASVGLWILATPIAELLYDTPEVGISIAILSPTALLLGLYQTTTAALHGIGKTYLPVKNLFIGVFIKGILNYVLVGIPALGIVGAGIASITGFSVALLLNYLDVKKHTQIKLQWYKILVVPVIAVSIMSFAVIGVYNFLEAFVGNNIATLVAVLIGGAIYGLGILVLGGIKADDIKIIPGIGTGLAGLLLRMRMIRK